MYYSEANKTLYIVFEPVYLKIAVLVEGQRTLVCGQELLLKLVREHKEPVDRVVQVSVRQDLTHALVLLPEGCSTFQVRLVLQIKNAGTILPADATSTAGHLSVILLIDVLRANPQPVDNNRGCRKVNTRGQSGCRNERMDRLVAESLLNNLPVLLWQFARVEADASQEHLLQLCLEWGRNLCQNTLSLHGKLL